MSLQQFISAFRWRCRSAAASLLTLAFLLAPLALFTSPLAAQSACERKCCKTGKTGKTHCCKRSSSKLPSFEAKPECGSCCHGAAANPSPSPSAALRTLADVGAAPPSFQLPRLDATATNAFQAFDRTRFQRPPPALA